MYGSIVQAVDQAIAIAIFAVVVDIGADCFLGTGAIRSTSGEIVVAALITRKAGFVPVGVVDAVRTTLFFPVTLDVGVQVAPTAPHANALHTRFGQSSYPDRGIPL